MSVHTPPKAAAQQSTMKQVTALSIRESKGVKKLTAITAYDFPTAVMVDEAGMDLILVGDSLGMAVLGRSDTVSVTLNEMIHHTRAVVAGASRALVVADMPFMTYEASVDEALQNASALAQASGVRAVKLEGGVNVAPQMEYFSYINPCGFTDRGVTSIAAEIGREVSVDEVKEIFKNKFRAAFGAQYL